MTFVGNIIWVICGGFFSFIEYMLVGILLCLTIIGIPFGIQCFKLALVSLAPFGVAFSDKGTGDINFLFNIIWVVVAGIWIALTHLLFGILLSITIIGIPFGRQHFKLLRVALAPFGKSYVRI